MPALGSEPPFPPGSSLRTLWRTLVDWTDTSVRITVGDLHTGFAFASLTGVMVDLDVEDDHLLVRLDNGGYLAVYQDMIESVGVGNGLIEVTYVAGAIEFVRLEGDQRPVES